MAYNTEQKAIQNLRKGLFYEISNIGSHRTKERCALQLSKLLKGSF